ncbi:MAG: hypothetical protein Q8N23_12720 [Archangium sp.]|nr:hypothetical protein [Archangium sp.]MDP3153534.1 hypothetical protein [Archangium sp.]MDP3574542.1 hypothetical protein [Archangium sp.]
MSAERAAHFLQHLAERRSSLREEIEDDISGVRGRSFRDAAGPALDALIAAGLEIDAPLALTTAPPRARGKFRLHGVRLRVLSPEDTAVFKMRIFRGKDLVAQLVSA